MFKKLFKLFIIIFVVLSFTFFCRKKEKIPTEKGNDIEFITKSIDLETGAFQPDSAQNEYQLILSDYMNELNDLKVKSDEKIEQIGPIEFSNILELSDKDYIIMLKKNLSDYQIARKNYFDTKAILLTKYRKKLGKSEDKTGRLEGTASQFIEILEESYIQNLNDLYQFLLEHHEIMYFTEDEVLIDNIELVNELNQKWENTVKSATRLNEALEFGSNIMKEGLEDIKNEK